ncbi:transposase, partial [Streptococcus pseudopneumoniae]|uniref:transposase n=1 Tax=Streptococcus pseudopneumoniae TaxID=257758 RepID=UPI001F156F00
LFKICTKGKKTKNRACAELNLSERQINALQLLYSNAKLEATNNLIKLIKRNVFGFWNFENFKKRIFIALNIKKERTKFVLSES